MKINKDDENKNCINFIFRMSSIPVQIQFGSKFSKHDILVSVNGVPVQPVKRYWVTMPYANDPDSHGPNPHPKGTTEYGRFELNRPGVIDDPKLYDKICEEYNLKTFVEEEIPDNCDEVPNGAVQFMKSVLQRKAESDGKKN